MGEPNRLGEMTALLIISGYRYSCAQKLVNPPEMHMLCSNYCFISEPCTPYKTFTFMMFSSSVMTEFQSKHLYKL